MGSLNPDKLEFFKCPGLFSGTPLRGISTFTKIFSKVLKIILLKFIAYF